MIFCHETAVCNLGVETAAREAAISETNYAHKDLYSESETAATHRRKSSAGKAAFHNKSAQTHKKNVVKKTSFCPGKEEVRQLDHDDFVSSSSLDSSNSYVIPRLDIQTRSCNKLSRSELKWRSPKQENVLEDSDIEASESEDIEASVSEYSPSVEEQSEPSTIDDGDNENDKEENSVQKPTVSTSSNITDTDIKVLQTNNEDGVRKYDKKQYCLYCGLAQSRLIRHLQNKHSNEREVIEITNTKDKGKKSQLMTKVRNTGNHLHNCEVLRQGSGDFLVTYRPKYAADAHQYRPCEDCLGYFVKTELWRHNCTFRSSNTRTGRVAEKSMLLLPCPNGYSTSVYALFNGMQNGPVKLIAKTDDLIIRLTSKLILKHGLEKKEYVRCKVRELTRFLIQFRRSTDHENAKLADCLNPSVFREVTEAVRVVAGFDPVNLTYSTPSLALKIGHSLNKCAKLLKGQAIVTRNTALAKDCDDFVTLSKLEWNDEVSGHALNTLYARKRNTLQLLPITKDIKVLTNFLLEKAEECRISLEAGTHDGGNFRKCYRDLAELTLARVILFNRRRQGEVSKLTIYDYEKRKGSDTEVDVDITDSLSRMERELCKLFVRVEVPGKRGRTVPILFTQDMQDSITLLMKFREQIGVPETNKYIFAYTNFNSMSYLRGSDCLRRFAAACGAHHPQALRSTNLRKQIATMSQILNMKDHELDLLAQYMGHNIKIHREYYRLPQNTVQIAKLSKLFLMMEEGTIATNQGKSLDDILADINVGMFIFLNLGFLNHISKLIIIIIIIIIISFNVPFSMPTRVVRFTTPVTRAEPASPAAFNTSATTLDGQAALLHFIFLIIKHSSYTMAQNDYTYNFKVFAHSLS